MHFSEKQQSIEGFWKNGVFSGNDARVGIFLSRLFPPGARTDAQSVMLNILSSRYLFLITNQLINHYEPGE